MPETTPAKELYLGKYESKEEAEKGLQNLVGTLDRFKQQNAELQGQLQAHQQLQGQYEKLLAQASQPVPAPREALVDDEGHLNAEALLREIDNRLTSVQKQFEKVPDLVNQSVQQLLKPLAAATSAKEGFFAREDVDSRFTDVEFQAMLRRNPGINKVFTRLMSDPETQTDAYETVYELWKSNKAVAPARPSAEKEAAGMPKATGGPPAEIPGEGQVDVKTLLEKARLAQDGLLPGGELAFAKEWIQNSKIKENLDILRQQFDGLGG